MKRPLISLEKVDVALDEDIVLHNISWRLMPGEHWAVLGSNGSGKSTLLRLIRGELWPAPGSQGRRIYAFNGEEQTTAVGVKEKIAVVSPEIQARYLRQEWKLNVLQVVHSGFGGGDYVYRRLSSQELEVARKTMSLLRIEPLLRRDVQTLSTGELRKVLIARALVSSPPILVCDEVCDGLDAPSRASLLAALEQVARGGTQLLYTTHRRDELLEALTHRLVLRSGRIVELGRISKRERMTAGQLNGGGYPAKSQNRDAGILSRKGRHIASGKYGDIRASEPLIRIENADVFLDRRKVLHRINWSIRRGEHWAIVGANGAGKSTLLKLMAGDLHPAWGGRVRRFGFTAKNSLWELRRKIGFVSPELQATYREAITGEDVIASGYFSSVGLIRKPGIELRTRARRLAGELGMSALAAKSALRVSYGEFRRILLARALVHRPEVLIFDEPFDGLDASSRAEMAAMLERTMKYGVTLIVVTHHSADVPHGITHVAELEAGRVVFQGCLQDHLCAHLRHDFDP